MGELEDGLSRWVGGGVRCDAFTLFAIEAEVDLLSRKSRGAKGVVNKLGIGSAIDRRAGKGWLRESKSVDGTEEER